MANRIFERGRFQCAASPRGRESGWSARGRAKRPASPRWYAIAAAYSGNADAWTRSSASATPSVEPLPAHGVTWLSSVWRTSSWANENRTAPPSTVDTMRRPRSASSTASTSSSSDRSLSASRKSKPKSRPAGHAAVSTACVFGCSVLQATLDREAHALRDFEGERTGPRDPAARRRTTAAARPVASRPRRGRTGCRPSSRAGCGPAPSGARRRRSGSGAADITFGERADVDGVDEVPLVELGERRMKWRGRREHLDAIGADDEDRQAGQLPARCSRNISVGPSAQCRSSSRMVNGRIAASRANTSRTLMKR